MSAKPAERPTQPSLRDDVFWQVGAHRLRRAPSPRIMGIVNVTPDSFSDGGHYVEPAAAVQHGLQLVEDGADILDIGGESSRPGATAVPADVELGRIRPVLVELRRAVDVPISIDTTKASVARAALELGADIVNDISGLRFDDEMLPLVATRDCGIVVMHMQGEPRTMQEAPHYDDVVHEVGAWLKERSRILTAAGVDPQRVVLDPGIGFGKRYADNVTLLRGLDELRCIGHPLLIGASRKRFLGWLLNEPEATQRLEGDLAIAAFCRASGVEILRVHDVRATRRVFRILDALDGTPLP